jgi:ABC-type transport system substrate-binding protein
VNRTITPFADMTPTLTQDLASIGIQVKVRELDTGTAYTTIQTLKNLVPIAANAGWGKDYADPSTFAVLFDSSGVNCTGQINYAEIGITAAQAKECGVTAAYNKYKSTIPDVNDQIKTCNAKTGQDRRNCWIDFDKNLMENVVPWVPYLWGQVLTVIGKSVTKYEFDQFSGSPSFCHIAVNNKATVS